MSAHAYNYLQQILNAMPSMSVECTQSLVLATAGISTCKNSMAVKENNILNDSNLSAEEKVFLLCSASVARHSFAYWSKQSGYWFW
jgi:hypothetical protein